MPPLPEYIANWQPREFGGAPEPDEGRPSDDAIIAPPVDLGSAEVASGLDSLRRAPELTGPPKPHRARGDRAAAAGGAVATARAASPTMRVIDERALAADDSDENESDGSDDIALFARLREERDSALAAAAAARAERDAERAANAAVVEELIAVKMRVAELSTENDALRRERHAAGAAQQARRARRSLPPSKVGGF